MDSPRRYYTHHHHGSPNSSTSSNNSNALLQLPPTPPPPPPFQRNLGRSEPASSFPTSGGTRNFIRGGPIKYKI
ncbi:hypothetical protein HN873_045001 [Arachis hypogaea]